MMGTLHRVVSFLGASPGFNLPQAIIDQSIPCAGDDADKMGALHGLVGFLGALTNADSDGRIILDPAAAAAKFVLLNAAAHFRKVNYRAFKCRDNF